MMRAADILIPTCKTAEAVRALVAEIERTAAGSPRIIATCHKVSAAANRNLALDMAQTETVVMLDDDVTGFPQGWNVTLADSLRADSALVVVSACLMQPNGAYAQMLGDPDREGRKGLVYVERRELPTACIAFRDMGLRFDERFVGSGWEDSVTEDMPVIVDRGRGIEIIPICDLYPWALDGTIGLRGCHVLAASGWTRCLMAHRHTVRKRVLRVRTQTGLICVTPDHSLMSMGNPVAVSEFSPGMKIDMVPLRTCLPQRQGITVDDPWLRGLFAAEGHACDRVYEYDGHNQRVTSARIGMQDEDCIDRVCAKTGWKKYRTKPDKRTGHVMFTAEVRGEGSAERARQWLSTAYSDRGQKIVPRDILRSSDGCVADFLAGYLKGDGHVEMRPSFARSRICYTTDSMALALGVQVLSAELGQFLSVNVRNDKRAINLRSVYGTRGTNATCKKQVPPEDDGKVRAVDDVTRFYCSAGGTVPVYDLTTEDGTFVAGLGGIVAHNTAWCAAWRALVPDCKMAVNCDVKVTHLNEMKGQGVTFEQNKRTYAQIWGAHPCYGEVTL